MELGMSERVQPLVSAVRTFINERVLPVDGEFQREVEKGDRWTLTDRQAEILDDLKSAAAGIGADHVLVNTSDSLDQALRNYLLFRQRRQ